MWKNPVKQLYKLHNSHNHRVLLFWTELSDAGSCIDLTPAIFNLPLRHLVLDHGDSRVVDVGQPVSSRQVDLEWTLLLAAVRAQRTLELGGFAAFVLPVLVPSRLVLVRASAQCTHVAAYKNTASWQQYDWWKHLLEMLITFV